MQFSAANTSLAAILSEQVFNNEKKTKHQDVIGVVFLTQQKNVVKFKTAVRALFSSFVKDENNLLVL